MTLPAILIVVFRECLEAFLIIATLLTALKKLHLKKLIYPVYLGAGFAALLSLSLLILNSQAGSYLQSWYVNNEAFIEATLAISSAIFITWAALFLHETFSVSKITLLQKINQQLEGGTRGIFLLTFTAVFREGLEIVFFLSSAYLTSTPEEIFGGFIFGLALSLVTLFIIFRSTLRISLVKIFRLTTFLLILFAAGLLVKGMRELSEIGWLPTFYRLSLPLYPMNNLLGELIKGLFGITKVMDLAQIGVYLAYVIYLTKRLIINQNDHLHSAGKPTT